MKRENGKHSNQFNVLVFGERIGTIGVSPYYLKYSFLFLVIGLILLGSVCFHPMEGEMVEQWDFIPFQLLGLKIWTRSKRRGEITHEVIDNDPCLDQVTELQEEIDRLRAEIDAKKLVLEFRNHQRVKVMEQVGKIEGNEDIVKRICTIVNEDKDQRFVCYLEQKVNIFHSRLIRKISLNFPGITRPELELCYWLFLGLDTKGISELTFRSPGSVKVQRSRLRKKLGMTDGSQSLVGFLDHLSRGIAEE